MRSLGTYVNTLISKSTNGPRCAQPRAESRIVPHVLDADIDVRCHIYDVALRSGIVPTREACARALARPLDSVDESLRRLHDAHQIVLAAGGEILMAMPFSAVPTPFEIHADGYRSYANCGWDALGIAAMLGRDVVISSSCPDCGDPITLAVGRERGVTSGDARLHFALPVRRWWESVVFT